MLLTTSRKLTEIVIQNLLQFENFCYSDISTRELIVGTTCSGKTTLLWGIVLFLRGFNVLCSQSFENQKVRMNAIDVTRLLNFGQISALEWLPHKQQTSAPVTITAKLNETNYKCSLKANGNMEFSPEPQSSHEKIRFAFIGVDPIWSGAYSEMADNNEILTTSVPNYRGRYRLIQSKVTTTTI